MRYLLSLLVSSFAGIFCLQSQPVGSWHDYLPYGSAIDLAAAPDRIFAATPYTCFSLDENDVFERFSRTTGLSETGVQTIFCTPNGTLVIAYTNSSVDILAGGEIFTVNALQLKPVNGDKTIYQVSGDDKECLLSTGFGIVVLNLEKNEIGDTWIPGNNGEFISVSATVQYGGSYYAATEAGLQKIIANSGNPADYRNWQLLSGSNGLPAGAAKQVFVAGGSLYVQAGNSLYKGNAEIFQRVYTDSANWLYAGGSANGLLVCGMKDGVAMVQELSLDGGLVQTIRDPYITKPRKAISYNNSIWIADNVFGLLAYTQSGISRSVPNSPASIGSGDVLAKNRDWWLATGSSVSHFSDATWHVYNADGQTLPSDFKETGPLLLDNTGNLWAGSMGGGLLKWKEGQVTIYKQGLLGAALDDPKAYRVGGLASDRESTLWITNPGAAKGLVARLPSGSSIAFNLPYNNSGSFPAPVLVDDMNQKWLPAPGGSGLFCFNHGADLQQTADDQWRKFSFGKGNGNLPSNKVNCLANDLFGFIWIGTADGIGIIQCSARVFGNQGCEAVLPVVSSGQLAGYLFKGEEVQAISVDGANRKWIGTKNGAWLISETGDKTIHHFTTANSPILSNDVRKIAIDPVDGTVLLSTAAGLSAFKGDATAGGERNEQVLVYPNPVPPGYTGQVAIRGLVNNAFVKITELNGRLVFQSRAAGGQLVWNGRDLQGKAIGSGVYLVFISDDSRKEQLVTKIVFIQQ